MRIAQKTPKTEPLFSWNVPLPVDVRGAAEIRSARKPRASGAFRSALKLLAEPNPHSEGGPFILCIARESRTRRRTILNPEMPDHGSKETSCFFPLLFEKPKLVFDKSRGVFL